jgi:hypothetical protein
MVAARNGCREPFRRHRPGRAKRAAVPAASAHHERQGMVDMAAGAVARFPRGVSMANGTAWISLGAVREG